MENILKSVRESKKLTLEEAEVKKLSDYIDGLEKAYEDGQKYRLSLTAQAKKSFAVVLPSLDGDSVDEITKSLSSAGLEKLCKSLKKQEAAVIPAVSQFYKENGTTDNTNSQFKF